MSNEPIRLNKYLAQCGVCSRRDGDKLIQKGVVQVNGETAKMGQTVTSMDQITVKGRVIQGLQKKVIFAYYKPIGVTCTERDAHAKKLVVDQISCPERVTYAGRLDRESEGLMLMTNDGDLIDSIMRAANGHEKEYQVRVNKEVTEQFLFAMEAGVYLKELNQKTRPCKIKKDGKYSFTIILTQGLNKQIRRMCKELGYQVTKLKRVRIMNIQIGDLKPNQYRELSKDEEFVLRMALRGQG